MSSSLESEKDTVHFTAQPARVERSLPRSGRSRVSARTIVNTALVFVAAAIWFSPLIILLLTSLRSPSDFAQRGPLALPTHVTFSNFVAGWQQGDFSHTFTNSAMITAAKVPLGVLLAAMVAFALAHLRVFGRRTLLFAFFIGLTVPIYIALVPLFTLTREMGLIDNIFGLLGPYLAFGLPFEVLVLYTFFRQIPVEILEAARVDGAGNWRMFFGIVIPLSVPALITVAILDAVATWNELLMALVIISSDTNKTLPLGLLNFQGQFSTNYTALAAAILIAVVPILAVYALLQRWIVSGLTVGAVKG